MSEEQVKRWKEILERVEKAKKSENKVSRSRRDEVTTYQKGALKVQRAEDELSDEEHKSSRRLNKSRRNVNYQVQKGAYKNTKQHHKTLNRKDDLELSELKLRHAKRLLNEGVLAREEEIEEKLEELEYNPPTARRRVREEISELREEISNLNDYLEDEVAIEEYLNEEIEDDLLDEILEEITSTNISEQELLESRRAERLRGKNMRERRRDLTMEDLLLTEEDELEGEAISLEEEIMEDERRSRDTRLPQRERAASRRRAGENRSRLRRLETEMRDTEEYDPVVPYGSIIPPRRFDREVLREEIDLSPRRRREYRSPNRSPNRSPERVRRNRF